MERNSFGTKKRYLPGSLEILGQKGEIKLKVMDQEIEKDLEKIEALYKDKKIDESQYLMLILLNKICRLLYKMTDFYLK